MASAVLSARAARRKKSARVLPLFSAISIFSPLARLYIAHRALCHFRAGYIRGKEERVCVTQKELENCWARESASVEGA